MLVGLESGFKGCWSIKGLMNWGFGSCLGATGAEDCLLTTMSELGFERLRFDWLVVVDVDCSRIALLRRDSGSSLWLITYYYMFAIALRWASEG